MNSKLFMLATLALPLFLAITSCNKADTDAEPDNNISAGNNSPAPNNNTGGNNGSGNNGGNNNPPTPMIEFKIDGVKYTGTNVLVQKQHLTQGVNIMKVVIPSTHMRNNAAHSMTLSISDYKGIGLQQSLCTIHFSRMSPVDTFWESIYSEESLTITKDNGTYMEGTFSCPLRVTRFSDPITKPDLDTVYLTEGKFIAKY